MKYFILASLFSFSAVGQSINNVNQGQAIEANKINELISSINLLKEKVQLLENKILPVGTIIDSFLTPVQMQQANGDCWKLMNDQSISGTELATLTSMSTLPAGITNGVFRRQAKTGRVLGSFESDDNKEHSHFEKRSSNAGGGGPYVSSSAGNWGSPNANGSISTNLSGEAEARPKNIAVNMFVKIKSDCVMN